MSRIKKLLVGDIVLAKLSLNEEAYILARILGKAGDEISITSREAFRNGIQVSSDLFPQNKVQLLPILALGETDSDQKAKLIIPERTLFLLSDNREISIDSGELSALCFGQLLRERFIRYHSFCEARQKFASHVPGIIFETR